MPSRLRKSVTIGFLGVVLSLAAHSAQANPVLPGLTNLDFLTYTGVAPKAPFTDVNPTGWTGGNGLIFITVPGTAANPNTACGTVYLQTYGCPSTLPIGPYNMVEADGNPAFESGFNYALTGLTPGQTYTLSFYQASGQQTGFLGDTTEQWIVSLGTAGLDVCPGCLGGGNSFYSNSDPTASVVATNLMSTPSQGMVDWQFVSVDLTADSPNQLLSFLAWGNNGNTANLPPMLFLTAVNAPNVLDAVPEPATLTLLGSALLAGFAKVRQQRRAKGKNTPTV
jgi:hypothetical protein